MMRLNIGNNVLLSPKVNIFTPSHPIDANVRNTNLEFGNPINTGNNVWIGGNTVINFGVKSEIMRSLVQDQLLLKIFQIM